MWRYEMARKRTEPLKQISVQLPKVLVDELDMICASNLLSRSSYIFNAVREKFERDRSLQERDIIEKLTAK